MWFRKTETVVLSLSSFFVFIAFARQLRCARAGHPRSSLISPEARWLTTRGVPVREWPLSTLRRGTREKMGMIITWTWGETPGQQHTHMEPDDEPTVASVPNDMKGLRACMVCMLVKTFAQVMPVWCCVWCNVCASGCSKLCVCGMLLSRCVCVLVCV